MSIEFIKNNKLSSALIAINLEKTLNIYKKILSPLLNLELYDKLGIIENISYEEDSQFIDTTKINFRFYLDKYKFYTPFSRWFYSQSRELIFTKMNVIFMEFNLLLTKIKILYHNDTKKWFALMVEYEDLCKLLLIKLDLLKQTYNNEDINKIINKYISYLDYFVVV